MFVRKLLVEVRVEPSQFEFEVPAKTFTSIDIFFHEESVVGSVGKTSYFKKKKSLLPKFLEGNGGKGKIRSEFRKNSHA